MAITKVSNSVLNLSGNTDALGLPKGTDAQRPTPVAGMLRFNTTTGEFEGYDGTEWSPVGKSYTAGTGITLTGAEFSIGQSVGTSDTVQFGEVRSSGDVVAYYSSDRRLKDNVKNIENSLNKISSLGGYEFDWNNNQSTYKGHDIGVIAQEVKDVFPDLVIERENGYLAVKYEKLVAVLIEAIKELKEQVEILKSK